MKLIEKIYISDMSNKEKIDLLVREGTHTLNRLEKEVQKVKRISEMIKVLTGRA